MDTNSKTNSKGMMLTILPQSNSRFSSNAIECVGTRGTRLRELPRTIMQNFESPGNVEAGPFDEGVVNERGLHAGSCLPQVPKLIGKGFRTIATAT
jgi:hypothetical protein